MALLWGPFFINRSNVRATVQRLTGLTGVIAVNKGAPADQGLIDGCQALIFLPIAR